MEKNQENKTPEKANHSHNVETPPPPQTMYPIAPPAKNEESRNKTRSDDTGKEAPAEKKKKTKGKKTTQANKR